MGSISDTEEATSPEQLVDAHGRPYFLWDVDMTLEAFRLGLRHPDPEVRGYLAGKLMRQARPADVTTFLTLDEARELWPFLSRYLGRARAEWRTRLGIDDEDAPRGDR